MTPAELDAIEARAAAATPGPWVMEVRDEAFVFLMGSALQRRANHQVQHSFEYEHGVDPKRHADQYAEAEANARLIAAARTDVPALVAEVRRLRAAITQVLDEIADGDEPCYDGYCKQYIRDQIETLRAALAGREEP